MSAGNPASEDNEIEEGVSKHIDLNTATHLQLDSSTH